MRSSRPQMQPFARSWPPGRPSSLAMLVAYMVAAACAQAAFLLLEEQHPAARAFLQQYLALDAAALPRGQLWKLLSFTLLQQPVAMVAGVLALYFAGREVEPIVGSRHLAGLFILGNLVGAGVQAATLALDWLPAHTLLLGSTAGVAAILMAYATILPELELSFPLFLVWPVRVRAKALGWVLYTAAVGLLIYDPSLRVGPVACMAGGLVGWAYAKRLGFGNPMAWERYFIDRRQQAARLQRMPAAQFMREEVDPILEKIAHRGTRSLSRTEKRLLELGRAKLAEAAARPSTGTREPAKTRP